MLGGCGFFNFEFYLRMEVIPVSEKIVGCLFVLNVTEYKRDAPLSQRHSNTLRKDLKKYCA